MENRNGLAVAAKLSLASGTAERETALELIKQRPPKSRMTLSGDKAYDTKNFVRELRASGVVPHVAQNDKRSGGNAIDHRTTPHACYQFSQRKSKRVEKVFR